ncbi:MAG: hypothetical protein K8I27_13675 [Planctomycetes bacterium]|nr:hypothetical protein [Planctomycetota bacterium]
MNQNPNIHQNPRIYKDRKEELIVLWALWQDLPWMEYPLSRAKFYADLIALNAIPIEWDAVESAWLDVTASVGSQSMSIAREELGLLAFRYAVKEWSVEDLKEILKAAEQFHSDDCLVDLSKCRTCGREMPVSMFSYIQQDIAGERHRDPVYTTLIDEILDQAPEGATPNDAR